MSSKKYIIQQIDQLASEFPGVKFSYQFDEMSDTHFIEVLPKSFFEKYEVNFTNKQTQIVLDFINKFSEEGLAFITKDDLFKINNPEYVACINKYDTGMPNLSWNHEKLNELMTEYKPDFQTSFVFYQDIYHVMQNAISCKVNLNKKIEQVDFELLTSNLPVESINTDMHINEEVTDYSNFCLAA